MSNKDQVGKIQTVTGTIDPSELGKTSTHEHIFIDFLCMFTKPDEASEQFKANQPLRLDNLGWIKYDPFRNIDNLELNDESLAVDEILKYKAVGGDSIIEATTIGIGRDPQALAKISRLTGVNIITGAGYYVDSVHPENMNDKTISQLEEQISNEVQKGIGNTGIRAGIIGEIGCSWPLTNNESKVLKAAAKAQKQTGASILIHPGRNADSPFEILDVLSNSGADVSRVIIGHIERTIQDINVVSELAKSGCYLEYDLFGWEVSYYPLSDEIDMVNDSQRINYISQLIDLGYENKIVIAQDIFSKHRTTAYGGHGYGHIIENILPRMAKSGMTPDVINKIITENPSNILTIK